MSYDYNALVSQIAASRRRAAAASTLEEKLPHLQESVDAFSTLSGHCPMTPLLWMQYSQDTVELLQSLSGGDKDGGGEAGDEEDANNHRETRLQLLELGLSEFPGSAILQLYYLQQFSIPLVKQVRLYQSMFEGAFHFLKS